MGNVSGHNYILNSISVNKQGVLFAGGDNGMFRFCDWKTGYCFQEERTVVQPGSLDSEAGIFASTFDLTGTRLITCEADKTIKIWKEKEEASLETDPIDMEKWKLEWRARRRFFWRVCWNHELKVGWE